MLLSNIKEGEPDASLFAIPAGYHKLDLGSMTMPNSTAQPHN
jgi:hypothetical protein